MAKYDYHTVRATGEFELFDPVDPEEGNPYITAKVRVVSGPLAGEERSFIGSLSDKAAPYTAEALRALGWRCSDITKLEGLGEVNATMGLKMETYKGRTKERVSIWPLEKRAEAISTEQKSAFAARFASLAAAAAPVARGEFNAPSELPEKKETTAAPEPEEEASPF